MYCFLLKVTIFSVWNNEMKTKETLKNNEERLKISKRVRKKVFHPCFRSLPCRRMNSRLSDHTNMYCTVQHLMLDCSLHNNASVGKVTVCSNTTLYRHGAYKSSNTFPLCIEFVLQRSSFTVEAPVGDFFFFNFQGFFTSIFCRKAGGEPISEPLKKTCSIQNTIVKFFTDLNCIKVYLKKEKKKVYR